MARTVNGVSGRAVVPCLFCGTLNRVELARAGEHPKCGNCGRPILLDRPVAASDASFERVTADTSVPVLVDFYADWCGPCKIMAPVLDDLARRRAGDVLVVKLDTDRNPATGLRFNVRGIPTLILFRGGKEVARRVGAVPAAELEELLRGA